MTQQNTHPVSSSPSPSEHGGFGVNDTASGVGSDAGTASIRAASSSATQAPRPVSSAATAAGTAGVAFLYDGNGSQWHGMGALLLNDPVFHAAVAEVDALFAPLGHFSLQQELAGHNDADRNQHVEFAQPALFALQVGLTRVLAAHGLQPAAVAGHSIGEVAAAWACGALSLPDAVRVIYHRSMAQAASLGRGQMSAAALGEAEALTLLAQLELTGRVVLAGINSHKGVTLAGSPAHLDQVEAALARQRIAHKRLPLDYAFHSPAVDPERDQVLAALADIQPRETTPCLTTGPAVPRNVAPEDGPGTGSDAGHNVGTSSEPAAITFHSSVTGAILAGSHLDAQYWWDNIRQPVRFAQAMDSLIAAGFTAFVDIGGHPILRGYANECLKHAGVEGHVMATLHRNDGALTLP